MVWGLVSFEGIDLAALDCGRADVLAGTIEILHMDGDGPLVDEGKPVGMTGDVLHTLAEGGILKDGEASDAAHSAGLDDGIAKVRCLDELGTLQQQTIDLGGDQQPAALGGDMDGGELGAASTTLP